MPSSVRMILSLLDYLVVQMKCPIFFVSYSSIVRSSLTYECRRPKFDVDANQKQEVLTLTPSCVAAVDVLLNGQALSTQAQRIALIHFAICPPFDLLLLHQLRICARWPSSLPGQVLPSSNAHALSYKGTQTSFTTGQYRVVFQSLQSCWQTAPPLRHSRPCQPKSCFPFCISLRVDAFLFKHVVCLYVLCTT